MRLGYRAKSRGWDSGSAVVCLARIEGLKATKRVETFRIPCLDAGSTPATSTKMYASARPVRFCLDAGYLLRVYPFRLSADNGPPSVKLPQAATFDCPPPPPKMYASARPVRFCLDAGVLRH